MSDTAPGVIDELVVEVGIDSDKRSFDQGSASIQGVQQQAEKAAAGVGGLNVALASTSKQLSRLPKAQPMIAALPTTTSKGGLTALGGSIARLPSPDGMGSIPPLPPAAPPRPGSKLDINQKMMGAMAGYLSAGYLKDALGSADKTAKMSRAFNIDPVFLQALGHLHPSYGGTEDEGFNLLQMLNAMQSSVTMGAIPSNLSGAQQYASARGVGNFNLIDVFDDRSKSRQQLLEGLIREFDKIQDPQVKQETMTALGINQVGSRNILQGGFTEFANTVNEIANSAKIFRQEALDEGESSSQMIADAQRLLQVTIGEMASSTIAGIKSLDKDLSDIVSLNFDSFFGRRLAEFEKKQKMAADFAAGKSDRRIIINQTINQTINGGSADMASDVASKTKSITIKAVKQAQQQIGDR